VSLLRASTILVAVILAACATVENTPQQDLVWSAYNQCKAEGRIPANIQLTRIEPDGRAWYSTYSSMYGAQALERCTMEKISISWTTAPNPAYEPVLSP